MGKSHKVLIKDLYSAAILRCLSFPLVDLDRSQGNFVLFVFDDPGFSADKTLQLHWDGSLEINSRDFVESIRELKTRLHGQGIYNN